MFNESITRANMEDRERPQLPAVREDEVLALRGGIGDLLSLVQEAYDDLVVLTRRPGDLDILEWRERAAKAIVRWLR